MSDLNNCESEVLKSDAPAVPLAVALLHYPVLNKNGEEIASAVTNLDLHDIARASKTYGLSRFYVATPLADQKTLVNEIVSHWQSGYGATYNPDRKDALDLIQVVSYCEEVLLDMEAFFCKKPVMVVTSASGNKVCPNVPMIDCEGLSMELLKGTPHLLVLGTAWGLSPSLMRLADYVLEPLKGISGYNHLSVRTAAAIMFDRILSADR